MYTDYHRPTGFPLSSREKMACHINKSYSVIVWTHSPSDRHSHGFYNTTIHFKCSWESRHLTDNQDEHSQEASPLKTVSLNRSGIDQMLEKPNMK